MLHSHLCVTLPSLCYTPISVLHSHLCVTLPPLCYTPTSVLHSHLCVTLPPLCYTPTSVLHSHLCVTLFSHLCVTLPPLCYTPISMLHSHLCVTLPPLCYTPISVLHSHLCVTLPPLCYTPISVLHSHLCVTLPPLCYTPTSVLHCSPISVLHCQKAHKCSTVERTAMSVWWTPVHFFSLQSPYAGIVVQDPYTGEIQGQEKATRLQSRTVRSHLLQFKSYTITIFSSSTSPSLLPPSPPLLSEKAFLWGVECRTGCHSEGVKRRICQKGRLCKNISYRRLLGALWVRGKWGYHQLSCLAQEFGSSNVHDSVVTEDWVCNSTS